MNGSSARVLSLTHIKEHCSRLEHLAFIVKLLHCVCYFTVAQLYASWAEQIAKRCPSPPLMEYFLIIPDLETAAIGVRTN